MARVTELFRALGPGCRSWSITDDDDGGFLVALGAVPVHPLGEVGDVGAGLYRDGQIVGIELVAGADPPGPFEHIDVAVVGMSVRAAEIAFLPGEHLDIELVFARVAGERCGPVAAVVLPLDLVRQLDGRRRGIATGPGAGDFRGLGLSGRTDAG